LKGFFPTEAIIGGTKSGSGFLGMVSKSAATNAQFIVRVAVYSITSFLGSLFFGR